MVGHTRCTILASVPIDGARSPVPLSSVRRPDSGARRPRMDVNRRDALKILGGTVGASFAAALGSGRAAAQGSEIAVGSLLDGTGPINIYGLPMIDATKFAIDDINARCGVLGKKLKLVQLDG